MKLDYKQIKAITTGTVYIEETQKGLAFHRFSKEQEDFFFSENKYFTEEFFNTQFGKRYFGHMAKSTAGVMFDFYTDGSEMTIEIGENILPANAEKQIFDVYVNQKYKASFFADANIQLKLGKGRKRVTVYFPWANYPIVSGVSILEASECVPVGTGVNVLCIGDSITHGGNAKHPSKTWVTTMSRKLDVRVINQGVCGFVNDEGAVERICDPKIVVTAYGVNDYGRKTDEQLGADADAFIKKVKHCYPNAQICSILPIWTVWNTNPGNWFDEKRAILRKVYEQNDVYIIDGFKMVPHNVKYMQDGCVHPNEAGFAYYGSRMAKELKKFL